MAAAAKESKGSRGDLGRVVVIGGNGALGYHIVNQALESWTTSLVASIDLRCERNRNPAALYRECDITDLEGLTSALEDLKADVVIHTASPVASDHTVNKELYKKVNVDGTASVIKACQETGVKALVFTSSASVISDGAGGNLLNADERWPVIRGDQQHEYYSETKAAAEELVIQANRQEPYKLLTTSIRPSAIFGEGDVQTLAGFYNAYKTGRHKVQIGDNLNLFDFTYVGNVAHSHLLAARLLLATASSATVPLDHEKVDGECFFITNDSPVYFWDFARSVFAAAGDTSGIGGVWHLGKEVGGVLGVLSEIFSAVLQRTPTFTKTKVTITCQTRFFNITKAKRVLRYQPLWTLQEGVDRGVAWFLEQEKKQEAIKAQ